MTTITTLKLYMVGSGNHESSCDNGGYTDKTREYHMQHEHLHARPNQLHRLPQPLPHALE